MPETFSEPTPCDAVLVPSVVNIAERSDIKLAIFKLTARENYDQQKKNFSALVPGYFDGGYDDFNERRSKYYNEERLDMSVEEARSVLMTSVPQYAVEAWSKCMAARATGVLQAWVASMDENGAVLRVRWNPAPGQSPLSNTEVRVDPGVKLLADLFSPNENFVGEASVHVLRAERNKAIKGSFSGRTNGGALTCDFVVPRAPVLVSKPIAQSLHFGTAVRGAYKTPKYAGPAKVSVIAEARAQWEPRNDGQHWLTSALLVDGAVAQSSSKVDIAQGAQGVARTQAYVLEIAPGAQHNLEVVTDNRGAYCVDLVLSVTGEYTTLE